MPTLEQLSDRLWKGIDKTADKGCHPFAPLYRIEEVADGVAFYKGFSNVAVVKTDAGCVLIDTGSSHEVAQQRIFEKVRSYSRERIDTAIYSHGHVDHAYGLPIFLAEARRNSRRLPEVIGHERVAARMERYILTNGFNTLINTRQFGAAIEWPTDPIYPTETYRDRLVREIGGMHFEITHAKGETDDHSWVYLPERKVLYTGDLFIWAAPNAGNPQKVQRYAREWAAALRAMAARGAEVLLCGHGVPVFGRERVAQALRDTAAYLQSLHDGTVALMNEGAPLDRLIAEVRPPRELAEKPYLQPIYDEPEFIVRNIHRCYGGWHNDVPADLKPAPRVRQAQEIAALAGGAGTLVSRAAALAAEGDFRLACHLLDWAADAAPDSKEVHAVRADVYTQRARQESSTMARGIFRAAAQDSQKIAE